MGKKEDEPAKGMKRKFKKAKNPVSETKGMFPVGIYGCFKFYMGFKLAENLKKKLVSYPRNHCRDQSNKVSPYVFF